MANTNGRWVIGGKIGIKKERESTGSFGCEKEKILNRPDKFKCWAKEKGRGKHKMQETKKKERDARGLETIPPTLPTDSLENGQRPFGVEGGGGKHKREEIRRKITHPSRNEKFLGGTAVTGPWETTWKQETNP